MANRKSTGHLAVLALALIGMATLFVGPWASRSSAVGAGQIAFVDLQQVMDQYRKTDALKTGMRQGMEKKLGEIRQREEALLKEEEDLQFVNRDSGEFKERSLNLVTERFRLQKEASFLEQEWNQKVVSAYKEIVADIEKVIAELGKERGYLAIQQTGGEALNGSEVDEKEVVFKMKLRQVLYADPALDITTDVIRRLNQ